MSGENVIIAPPFGKPGGAIGWELAMSPPRSRRMFLRGSKHIVQTKYWSYSERRTTCFASRVPCMGRLARTHVFVLGLTRASSEYMGKGKCAPFSCSEPRRTNKGLNMKSDCEGPLQMSSDRQDAMEMRYLPRNARGRGADIAKGIRSCTTGLFVPVVAIAVGISVGQKVGWCLGVLCGIASFFAAGHAFKRYIIAKVDELTIPDCLLPIAISAVCSVVFFPFKFLTANVFSPITCLLAGVMLSFGLLAYRCGKLQNPWWLVPTAITFGYECLPFNLPSDIDNFLAVGANSVNFFFMNVIGINWHAGAGFLARTPRQEQIDMINREKYDHQAS